MIATPLRKLIGWDEAEVRAAELQLHAYKEQTNKHQHSPPHADEHDEEGEHSRCDLM